MRERSSTSAPILFFDGRCVLCNRAVLWVLSKESAPSIQFASLTSNTADRLLAGTPYAGHQSSILWMDNEGRVLEGADAALAVATQLRRPWRWLTWLRWVPKPIRKAVYQAVAQRRKRWFGQTDHCALLTELDSARLLP
ncbi:MAG: DUF393 domain-containing protein [Crocinitomicaceae bacterium TMED114]|nr:MAG: DUF393 domain-containing protein [Crocinitomicaceae bacterium TMED114]